MSKEPSSASDALPASSAEDAAEATSADEPTRDPSQMESSRRPSIDAILKRVASHRDNDSSPSSDDGTAAIEPPDSSDLEKGTTRRTSIDDVLRRVSNRRDGQAPPPMSAEDSGFVPLDVKEAAKAEIRERQRKKKQAHKAAAPGSDDEPQVAGSVTPGLGINMTDLTGLDDLPSGARTPAPGLLQRPGRPTPIAKVPFSADATVVVGPGFDLAEVVAAAKRSGLVPSDDQAATVDSALGAVDAQPADAEDAGHESAHALADDAAPPVSADAMDAVAAEADTEGGIQAAELDGDGIYVADDASGDLVKRPRVSDVLARIADNQQMLDEDYSEKSLVVLRALRDLAVNREVIRDLGDSAGAIAAVAETDVSAQFVDGVPSPEAMGALDAVMRHAETIARAAGGKADTAYLSATEALRTIMDNQEIVDSMREVHIADQAAILDVADDFRLPPTATELTARSEAVQARNELTSVQRWTLKLRSGKIGPLPIGDIVAIAKQGKIRASDKAQDPVSGEWKPITDFPDLMIIFSRRPTAANHIGQTEDGSSIVQLSEPRVVSAPPRGATKGPSRMPAPAAAAARPRGLRDKVNATLRTGVEADDQARALLTSARHCRYCSAPFGGRAPLSCPVCGHEREGTQSLEEELRGAEPAFAWASRLATLGLLAALFALTQPWFAGPTRPLAGLGSVHGSVYAVLTLGALYLVRSNRSRRSGRNHIPALAMSVFALVLACDQYDPLGFLGRNLKPVAESLGASGASTIKSLVQPGFWIFAGAHLLAALLYVIPALETLRRHPLRATVFAAVIGTVCWGGFQFLQRDGYAPAMKALYTLRGFSDIEVKANAGERWHDAQTPGLWVQPVTVKATRGGKVVEATANIAIGSWFDVQRFPLEEAARLARASK